MALIKKSFTTGIVSSIAVIGLFAGMYGLFFRLAPVSEPQNETPPQTAIIQDSAPKKEGAKMEQATTTSKTGTSTSFGHTQDESPDLSAFDDLKQELSDFDNRIEELDN